jgi:hypothetical protein
MDHDAVIAQLDAEVAAAGELALRLELLASVVTSGARHVVVDLATRDVGLATARLQVLESERLRSTGGTPFAELVAEASPDEQTRLEAAARRARRALARVDQAASRARECLAARMGAVEEVLAAYDTVADYDRSGRRRHAVLTGRGATA